MILILKKKKKKDKSNNLSKFISLKFQDLKIIKSLDKLKKDLLKKFNYSKNKK